MSVSYIALIITALLGVIGLVAKTSDDEKPGYIKRLTPFGGIVLVLLVGAFVTSLLNQFAADRKAEKDKSDARNRVVVDSLNELIKFTSLSNGQKNTIDRLQAQKKMNLQQIKTDSDRFNITLKNFGRQLDVQSKTLFNVQRNLVPIKDVYFTAFIEIPLDATPQLQQYKLRLANGIRKMLPDLERRGDGTDGVSVSSREAGGKILTVTISPKSSLWPNGSTEAAARELFGGVFGELFFYKTPMDNSKIPLIGNREDWVMPDLTMPVFGGGDETLSMQYDVVTNKVLLTEIDLKTDPKNWSTNARLVSILDLANAELVIRLSNNEGIKEMIKYCSIQINGFTVNLWKPNLTAFYDKTGSRNFFSYIFPKNMDTFLVKGVVKPKPSEFAKNK